MQDQKISNQRLQEYLDEAAVAASKARAVLLSYYGDLSKVQDKGREGLVSEADIESEKVIISYLSNKFPEIAFLAEEDSFKKQSEGLNNSKLSAQDQWIVDPLDGTTNYIHQFPIFCISIGLQLKGEIQIALIDVPLLDKTYTAIKGGGAFCNGQPIKVSPTEKLKDSLLATGFRSSDEELFADQLKKLKHFSGKCRGLRRSGAAAFDLCMVAAGSFQVFMEEDLKPWDVAAALLLVKEAGGQVTDYTGKPSSIYDASILATNSILHAESLGILGLK